jgi:hypothetical protein
LHRCGGHSGVIRLLAHRGKRGDHEQPVVGPVGELPRMSEVLLRQRAPRLYVEAHPPEEQYPFGDRREKRTTNLLAVVRPRQPPDVGDQVLKQRLAVAPAPDAVVRLPESPDLRAKALHRRHVNAQRRSVLKRHFSRVGGHGGG